MNLFAALIPRDSQVLEIGSHIGYVAQHYSALVGPLGRVFCFEPSPENLPYLKANVERSALRNIEIVEAAAGNRDGSATFFYESITGQNSTVVPDFRGLEINSSFNALPTGYQTCTVPMKKVDSFLAERQIGVGLTTKDVNFIKIDAEGGERDILLGMTDTMRRHPRLMVEINTNHAEVFGILTAAGYLLFDPSRVPVLSPDPGVFGGNIFAIHPTDTIALQIMRMALPDATPES